MCAILKMVRDKEVIPEGMGVTFLSVFHFLVYASDLIMLRRKKTMRRENMKKNVKRMMALAAAGILAAGALTGCGGVDSDTAEPRRSSSFW